MSEYLIAKTRAGKPARHWSHIFVEPSINPWALGWASYWLTLIGRRPVAWHVRAIESVLMPE